VADSLHDRLRRSLAPVLFGVLRGVIEFVVRGDVKQEPGRQAPHNDEQGRTDDEERSFPRERRRLFDRYRPRRHLQDLAAARRSLDTVAAELRGQGQIAEHGQALLGRGHLDEKATLLYLSTCPTATATIPVKRNHGLGFSLSFSIRAVNAFERLVRSRSSRSSALLRAIILPSGRMMSSSTAASSPPSKSISTDSSPNATCMRCLSSPG